MKRMMCLAAAVAVALFAPVAPSVAGETTAGDLTISHPMARPNLPNRPSAAYMVISNGGSQDDRLVAARSPAFKTIELHTVVKDGDVMKMEQIQAIDIPAGQKAMLQAGGLHLMLFGPVKRLKDGDSFPITLTFEHGGDVTLDVEVTKKAGQGHGGHGSGHGSEKDHKTHKGHGSGSD